MGAVVRVLAAGVLAGVLIESGAAEKIAETIVEKMGEKKVLLAIALSSMIITAVGIGPLSAAVMINTGAVVIDHLPHGNFFHASADAVKMNISDRMKLIPYESIIGGSMAIVATIMYGFLK